MRLSKPDEDPDVEPEPVSEEDGSGEGVVVIDGEEMAISTAVEKLDDEMAEAFGVIGSMTDRFDKQEEAIKELQEGVEKLADVYGHEGTFLDEDRTL